MNKVFLNGDPVYYDETKDLLSDVFLVPDGSILKKYLEMNTPKGKISEKIILILRENPNFLLFLAACGIKAWLDKMTEDLSKKTPSRILIFDEKTGKKQKITDPEKIKEFMKKTDLMNLQTETNPEKIKEIDKMKIELDKFEELEDFTEHIQAVNDHKETEKFKLALKQMIRDQKLNGIPSEGIEIIKKMIQDEDFCQEMQKNPEIMKLVDDQLKLGEIANESDDTKKIKEFLKIVEKGGMREKVDPKKLDFIRHIIKSDIGIEIFKNNKSLMKMVNDFMDRRPDL